ncbi:MAG: hypothetical protein B7Z08_10355 [Sphingomonadales bacterium 32-68-7]|nr:MAG: hypothetical protein B7Z33_05545 [Sphingomonadales bacterium 12-68-11]OYX08217.1 MAG: hypothetical protein B7Z08_10355 [Sphingomonadales bacterium 32-68-7]
MKREGGRAGIIGGWLIAMLASALPAAWSAAELAERNPLGIYADRMTGAFTPQLYWQFLRWWLPIAVPVSLLALACMFLNRRAD